MGSLVVLRVAFAKILAMNENIFICLATINSRLRLLGSTYTSPGSLLTTTSHVGDVVFEALFENDGL